MDDHIDWLKKQRDEASSSVETISVQHEEITRKLEESRKVLAVWTDALDLAMKQAGLPLEKRNDKTRKPKRRSIFTISFFSEQALKEHDSLSSKQLRDILQTKGKKTTVNTVTVALNRERPERFDRNENGDWFLVTKEKGDKEPAALS